MTAEYGMLPRSTHTRSAREAAKGKQSGRTQEIQRLIGRSLRAVTDLKALGERQITLDCDVLQADGGTRCASITGAWLALNDACEPVSYTHLDVYKRQVQVLVESFQREATPEISDPFLFLQKSMNNAHRAIIDFTDAHNLKDSPRTTCVACIVQHNIAYWAHAGDSRLYLMRGGKVLTHLSLIHI